MVICIVKGCGNRTGLDDGKKISFYRFPAASVSCDGRVQQLTSQRRALWLQRINRADVYSGARVCSDHFIAGQYQTLNNYL